jgi:hypothetical protein
MSMQTKIALTATLILGGIGIAQAAAANQAFTVAEASSGLGVMGTTGRPAPNTFSTQQPGLRPPSGANPSNPQDMMNRSNRQDMTVPRARNPQNLTR